MKWVFLLLACCLLITPAAAAGGSGTAADPYIIQTAAELQSMQNNLAAYYKLANDINLQGVGFTPIGSTSSPFTGSFDGAGYTISNLVSSINGFFGCLGSGATVKNIIFQDCSVENTQCGVVSSSVTMPSSSSDTIVISNVNCVKCSASSTTSNAGCLVGRISMSAVVEITDCNVSYSEVKTSRYNAGGLVGECAGSSSTKITNSNVLYSHIRTNLGNAGCFVAVCAGSPSLVFDSSSAQNCIVEGVSGNNIGCFVAAPSGLSSVNALNCDVVNCLAMGTNYVGGLIGVNSEGSFAASDCTVTGCTVVATSNYAGGIAGGIASGQLGIFSSCTVTDSTIIASDYAAGICPAYS